MNGMDDLITFLRARLAEAEAVIRKNLGINGLGDDGSYPDYRTYIDDDTNAADEFLTLFSPHCMLADVAAKRQIIDFYVGTVEIRDELADRIRAAGDQPASKDLDEWSRAQLEVAVLETPVRLLALAFADHSDYRREEWKP